MIWNIVQIANTCLRTRMRDPRRNPDNPFLYVDISAIDRNLKVITSAPEILGADAPSRARKEIREGDILVSTVRPNLNAVAVVPQHLDGQIASTGFCILRPNKSAIVGKYLFYFTTTPNFVGILSGKVRGAHYPAVSDSDVKEIELPLPTVSEQRRIVEILDQADALRKKRAEADAKAARILPVLFYKMFGDPATNPKGLVKKRLGDLIKVRSGNFLPAKNMDSTGHFPVYGGNGINGYHSEFMFEEPVIVLGRVGIYCGVVHYSEPNCWVTDNALYVAEQSKDLHARYLAEALRVANLNQYAGRAGQPLISGNRIYPIEILVPPPEEQEKFTSMILDLHRYESRRQSSGVHLETLFSVLMHRAFTGNLTAKWREAHMKDLLAEMEAQAKALDCPSTQSKSPEIRSKRHAGHDIYNKAALAAYITDRCHAPDRPMGRVKLAKLFYLVQQKAEIELTETFMKRAAGPLDDEIHKFLSLAQKSKWLVLCRGEGDLKPVRPGANVSKAVEQAQKLLGPAKAKVDEMLDQMKGWGYRALERWATVLDASFELTAAGQPATVEGVKDIIQRHPDWVPKLSRNEFSDTNIEATLKGLRGFGFITNQD